MSITRVSAAFRRCNFKLNVKSTGRYLATFWISPRKTTNSFHVKANNTSSS